MGGINCFLALKRRVPMLIDIDKIIVKDRIRKDYGNLEELAEDIRKNGLINPPAISRTYQLIAGERRLKACRDILGWKQIEVHQMDVDDAEKQLFMEISENESRKEFTMMERLDYARQIARVEGAKAQSRQKAGVNLSQNSDEGRTDEKAAEAIGTSRDTLRKAQYIADHKDDVPADDFADWDEGKLSTNKVFQNLKRQLADEQEKTKTLAGIRDRLVVEKAGLKKQIAEGSSDEIDKLNEQINDLQEQLEAAKTDADDWQVNYETVLRQMKKMDENPKVVEKIPDDYQTFRARCGEAERKVAIFQREKRKLLDHMDDQTDEINKLKNQIKALQNSKEKKEPDDIDAAISDLAYSLRIDYSQIGTKIREYPNFLKGYAENGSTKNKLELLMLFENLGRRCYEVKSLLQRASGTMVVNSEETIEDVIHDMDSELNTGLKPCDTTK